MKFRSILMSGLVLWLMATALPARAQELNCDTLPELEANRRPVRTYEECRLWAQSTDSLKIYYPLSGEGDFDVTQADLRRIKDAVETSIEAYQRNGFIPQTEHPPIYIWVSRTPAIQDVDADTNVLNNTPPCVMNIYWGAVLNSDRTPEQFKQAVAHEVFHCVQFLELNMSDALTGYTGWWAEGSADWASGIIPAYAGVNGEHKYSTTYEQHKSLIGQCDPNYDSACGNTYSIYATSLFFQDMSNQLGNAAVYDLLRQIAPLRSSYAQSRVIANTIGIDQVFEKFSQDYIDQKISDPGGGYMAQPDVIISEHFEIDNKQDLFLQSRPLTIHAYKATFARGKTYKITGLENQDGYRLSYRAGERPWISNEDGAPVIIDAACADREITISVSSAKESFDRQDFTLHAIVTNPQAVCACQCANPVPACVVGDWQSNNPPQFDLLVSNLMNVTRTGQNSAGFENGQASVDVADLSLRVSQDGSFSHSTVIDYHGSGKVSGRKITMQGGIRSSSTGTACLTQDQQICMQYQSTSQPTQMQITAMGMNIPVNSPGGVHSGSQTMPFSCTDTDLTLRPTLQGEGPVPTQEVTVKYHR